MTGRDLVSRVRSSNKLISADNNINDRVIFNMLKASAKTLIKRETNLRRLWNSPNIFTPIECLEMMTVPLSECCDYKNPCQVARSKKKIPQISEGIFGLLVQSVFSPGKKKFDYASPDRYANILRLGLRNTSSFYWIYNDYLYVSDPNIEYIDMLAFFDDEFNPADYSGCKKPGDTSENCTTNPLDREFNLPSYLEEAVLSLVDKKLMDTFFRHLVDPQTNFKDETKS